MARLEYLSISYIVKSKNGFPCTPAALLIKIVGVPSWAPRLKLAPDSSAFLHLKNQTTYILHPLPRPFHVFSVPNIAPMAPHPALLMVSLPKPLIQHDNTHAPEAINFSQAVPQPASPPVITTTSSFPSTSRGGPLAAMRAETDESRW